MINVKKTLNKVLKDWGHDVFIQRLLPNGNHADSFERVTVRSVGQSGVKNSQSRQEVGEGIDISYDAVYYMSPEVYPKEGDRIYENYSAKSHRNYTMFLIDTVTPVRGRFGHIEFWTVGATRER
jgi:hypothetical protein